MRRMVNRRRRREWQTFFGNNRRLFLFVGLFLAGAVVGVAAYHGFAGNAELDRLLLTHGVTAGWREALREWVSACFSTAVWLAVLFLLGLWPCGVPFVLAVPLIYGAGFGLTEACYYSGGWRGVLAVVAVILPSGLLHAAVLMMAGAESLRLSVRLTRQLLPVSAREPAGSTSTVLWPLFRLYCLRYLIFLAVGAAAGLAEVLLRTMFARLL